MLCCQAARLEIEVFWDTMVVNCSTDQKCDVINVFVDQNAHGFWLSGHVQQTHQQRRLKLDALRHNVPQSPRPCEKQGFTYTLE